MANFLTQVKDFFAGSYDELTTKVTWLKYSTLQKQTALVLIASLLFALLIGVVIDNTLDIGLSAWYKSNAPAQTPTPVKP